jgi:hypothetical protein
MTKLILPNLIRTCEVASINAPYKAIMASIGASEGLAYHWRTLSMAAEKRDERDSIWFFEWRTGQFSFWHRKIAQARVDFIQGYEAELRMECRFGRTEVVLGPTQEPVPQLDPQYLGETDEFIELCEGTAHSPGWYRILRDEDQQPVYLTKQIFPAPAIRLRILEQDRRYLQTQNLNVDVQTNVVHTPQPLQRRADENKVNLPELRRIASLSPEARRAELNASAFPKNAQGLVVHANVGAPRGDDRSDHIKDQQPIAPPPNPRMYEAPLNSAEGAAKPSYAKPSASLDQSSRGRGVPPSGGFRVVS